MHCSVPYPADHPFPIENLPYGVFSTAQDPEPRPGVAVGDCILDLAALTRTPPFAESPVPAHVFAEARTLDAFVALERSSWRAFRRFLQRILSREEPLGDDVLVPRTSPETRMHMPITIGDYTDFYASYEHAFNCGSLIRGADKALQPNWRHLPVAYHGRASSVVVSGTDFHRPSGQILASPGDTQPVFSPCKRLDYELEMGFIYGGKATQLGQRLSPQQAQEHIFGVVLLNDWSARDIQTWEYVPLGPFLSKNFCTTISPWVVSMDALEPFGVGQYAHEPALLPYLEHDGGVNYDVDLTVEIKAADDDEYHVVSRSSMKHMYYTLGQMLAHHSTTGCSMRPGDLLGTGTLSAPRPDGLGSLLEKSKLGREPFGLGSRKDMTFLRDGDCVRLTGSARGKGYTIGFGHCEGTVLPALPLLV